jgi:hypothetical protein
VSSTLSSLLAEKSPSNGQYVRQRAVYGHGINLLVAGGGGGSVCVAQDDVTFNDLAANRRECMLTDGLK